jgi:C_GCAxxG_C_C family probable redox protein
MHKAYGYEDDTMLWTGTNFFGGIAGHQDAVCGAVTALGICLGVRYRDTSGDQKTIEEAKRTIIRKTDEIVRQFKKEFGTLRCIDLAGLDYSDREAVEKYIADPEKRKICPGYVSFIIKKLYESEDGD